MTQAVSIHAPAKGATGFETCNEGIYEVSIHAPAKGATKLYQCRERFYVVSIHAPAKGATGYQHPPQCGRRFQSTLPRRERLTFRRFAFSFRSCFNPRSREGSDLDIVKIFYIEHVSIHAPAKGATIASLHYFVLLRFQSTLPRRERLSCSGVFPTVSTRFNPRSREGSDCADGELSS